MRPDGVNAFPLAWPAGWPRAKRAQRSAFKSNFRAARDSLFNQIRLMGGTHVVLSSNIPLRLDGLPRAGQPQPQDKGIAVYFLRRGKQMVFACDRWDKVEDNIRAIEKTIEAMRGIDRWGASEMMERAFTAFEALPPPRTCWDILGVQPGSSAEEIKSAYRRKARSAHPDAGGSESAMAELNRAYEQALATLRTDR
jgi:hypothetical protein